VRRPLGHGRSFEHGLYYELVSNLARSLLEYHSGGRISQEAHPRACRGDDRRRLGIVRPHLHPSVARLEGGAHSRCTVSQVSGKCSIVHRPDTVNYLYGRSLTQTIFLIFRRVFTLATNGLLILFSIRIVNNSWQDTCLRQMNKL
jgi:hypothetical protein